MQKYIDKQKQKNIVLIESGFFDGDFGNGVAQNGVRYPYVLNNSENNLHSSIRSDVFRYFEANDISLQGVERTVNSQAACLNHLFPIRNDKDSVLNILKAISEGFSDVYIIDENMGEYIQFEAVGGNTNFLNEGTNLRGRLNTSIDALIYAKHDNEKVLVPIEWKYCESYGSQEFLNDSTPSRNNMTRGEIRKSRYYGLIENSARLKTDETKKCSNYEPFYQLMRQTLWAEQVMQNVDVLKADDFFHIHVIPRENYELLNRKYICSGEDLETTWKNCLVQPDKYNIISPSELWNFQSPDTEIFNYLKDRYWT